MTDTPQDGELGNYSGAVFVKANAEGQWCDPHGKPVFYQDEVVPVAERAVPIGWHDHATTAAEMRSVAKEVGGPISRTINQWADILDPPKPRWPENTVLMHGGSAAVYIVNAKGVPCLDGQPTDNRLDPDKWRVIGKFTPTEGDDR